MQGRAGQDKFFIIENVFVRSSFWFCFGIEECVVIIIASRHCLLGSSMRVIVDWLMQNRSARTGMPLHSCSHPLKLSSEFGYWSLIFCPWSIVLGLWSMALDLRFVGFSNNRFVGLLIYTRRKRWLYLQLRSAMLKSGFSTIETQSAPQSLQPWRILLPVPIGQEKLDSRLPSLLVGKVGF